METNVNTMNAPTSNTVSAKSNEPLLLPAIEGQVYEFYIDEFTGRGDEESPFAGCRYVYKQLPANVDPTRAFEALGKDENGWVLVQLVNAHLRNKYVQKVKNSLTRKDGNGKTDKNSTIAAVAEALGKAKDSIVATVQDAIAWVPNEREVSPETQLKNLMKEFNKLDAKTPEAIAATKARMDAIFAKAAAR